jgi:hypothetical protein
MSSLGDVLARHPADRRRPARFTTSLPCRCSTYPPSAGCFIPRFTISRDDSMRSAMCCWVNTRAEDALVPDAVGLFK